MSNKMFGTNGISLCIEGRFTIFDEKHLIYEAVKLSLAFLEDLELSFIDGIVAMSL